MPEWLPPAVLGPVLLLASISDVRHRTVPLWLVAASIGGALVTAALLGTRALEGSAIGLAAGGLPALPLVLAGGFGPADALLLAAIGAWEGWRVVLWTASWAALAGAILALVAWRRGQRSIPYVPAIAVGMAAALLAR